MANNPKVKNFKDDDVILYMNERGNGLAVVASKESDDDEDDKTKSIADEDNNNKTGDDSHHLETDNVNNNNNNNHKPTLHPLHPNYHNNDRDVEVFEPDETPRPHRDHYPGIDPDLLPDPDDDDEPSSMRPSSPKPRPGGMFPSFFDSRGGTPDVNVYQQKKTIAQGFLDLALISANANQFRYVLQSNGRHPFYYPSLAMIGTSLFLQVIVGIGLIWNSRYNVTCDEQMCKANRANNWTVIAIFLVTILNVFISSFGVIESLEGNNAMFPSSSSAAAALTELDDS